jgi:hypothetical protein
MTHKQKKQEFLKTQDWIHDKIERPIDAYENVKLISQLASVKSSDTEIKRKNLGDPEGDAFHRRKLELSSTANIGEQTADKQAYYDHVPVSKKE